MVELPSARIVNTPLQRLVRYCKPLLIGTLLLAPIWYAVHRCTEPQAPPQLTAHEYVDHAVDDTGREKIRPYLAKMHDRARAHLRKAKAPQPRGLDPLFERLLARVDYRVQLNSEQQVDYVAFRRLDEEVGDRIAHDLTDSDQCAKALTAAFENVTGSDVIEVVSRYNERGGIPPVLTLRWDIAPTAAPNAIVAKGTVNLTVWGTEPLSESFDLRAIATGSGSAVGPTLLHDVCSRIGRQLIEHLTGLPEAVNAR